MKYKGTENNETWRSERDESTREHKKGQDSAQTAHSENGKARKMNKTEAKQNDAK